MTLDAAAVSDQAVVHLSLIAVVGRRFILDARQDRTGALEYLVANVLVEHIHVGAEVIRGILDLDRIFVEQIACYRAVDQCTGQELALEVDAVMGHAVGQHMDEVLAVHDVDAERNVLALAFVRVADADIDRFLLAIELNIGGERRILLLLGADHGQIRTRFLVALDNLVERNVGDDVAVRDDNVVRLVLLEEVDRAGQRVDLAAVLAGHERRRLLGIGIRRKDGDARVLAGQVPVLRVADMVDEGLILVLHQDADAVDAGVHHVGQHEVYDAVASAPLDCGDRAVLGQLAQIVIVIKCNNNA